MLLLPKPTPTSDISCKFRGPQDHRSDLTFDSLIFRNCMKLKYLTQKSGATYGPFPILLSATNGNLLAVMDHFHQNIVDLLLQPLNFVMQLCEVGIDGRAFHFPHSLEAEEISLFLLPLIP